MSRRRSQSCLSVSFLGAVQPLVNASLTRVTVCAFNIEREHGRFIVSPLQHRIRHDYAGFGGTGELVEISICRNIPITLIWPCAGGFECYRLWLLKKSTFA